MTNDQSHALLIIFHVVISSNAILLNSIKPITIFYRNDHLYVIAKFGNKTSIYSFPSIARFYRTNVHGLNLLQLFMFVFSWDFHKVLLQIIKLKDTLVYFIRALIYSQIYHFIRPKYSDIQFSNSCECVIWTVLFYLYSRVSWYKCAK